MSRLPGLGRVCGEQLLGRHAVALHHAVRAVEDVAHRLARKGRATVAGRPVELEEEQPVGAGQPVAEGEEFGRRRVVGQAVGQPRFTPG
ncbi:hypothetical protein ACFWA9_38330 [Kitasatospora sp. NPDC059973]|uniref:hypothetical protein n=1 Tax=Kitasatospora sp. NPDC059973 TaxID=3347020 RepID=UPI00369A1063